MAATAASLQPQTSQQTKPTQQQSTMIRPNSNIAPHHHGNNQQQHTQHTQTQQQQQQQQPSMMGIITAGPSSTAGVSSNITAPPSSLPMNFNMNSNDVVVQGHVGSVGVGVGVGASAGAGATGGMNASASRSISLPDMARYAARANAEDNKRKKRLARNRASARLRRLKKKNLVSLKEKFYFALRIFFSQLYIPNSCIYLDFRSTFLIPYIH